MLNVSAVALDLALLPPPHVASAIVLGARAIAVVGGDASRAPTRTPTLLLARLTRPSSSRADGGTDDDEELDTDALASALVPPRDALAARWRELAPAARAAEAARAARSRA